MFESLNPASNNFIDLSSIIPLNKLIKYAAVDHYLNEMLVRVLCENHLHNPENIDLPTKKDIKEVLNNLSLLVFDMSVKEVKARPTPHPRTEIYLKALSTYTIMIKAGVEEYIVLDAVGELVAREIRSVTFPLMSY